MLLAKHSISERGLGDFIPSLPQETMSQRRKKISVYVCVKRDLRGLCDFIFLILGMWQLKEMKR